MNQQEMEAKAKEVFSDEEYVKELFNLETAEEVQASLKEKGIELTTDEIMQLKELLEKSADEELTDEDLEKVGGGFAIEGIIAVLGGITAGLAVISGAAVVVDTRTRRRW